MKTKTEYGIVRETTVDDLERKVNECLRNGWELVGGVAAVMEHTHYVYYLQAMVKHAD